MLKTIRRRVAPIGCALMLLLSGCAAPAPEQPDSSVTVHFDDGKEYSFTDGNATYIATLLHELKYATWDIGDAETPYTVDTEHGSGYRINTADCFVYYNGARAWLTADQSERLLTIFDWARARLPKESTTTTTTTTQPPSAPASYKISGVPVLGQQANFPTGCEATAAVMALRYAGVNITVSEFVDKHLPQSSDFTTKDGQKYGPSPYEYFLGDPRSDSAYGCMAPVIEKALTSVLGNKERVRTATGMTMTELCQQYVCNDIPVLVWATIEMSEPKFTDSWILPDGTKYTWPTNEHCLVLIGYDDNRYYFNDPYSGRPRSCLRELGEKRYTALGSQAIAIMPK